MHADRTNRVALALFGLLVLAAGAAGLAASTGAFGAPFSRRTLFDNQVSDYFGHHGGWLWPAIAGACLLTRTVPFDLGSDDKVLVMRVIVIATMGFLGNYYFRIQRDRLARASRGDRSTLAEIRAGLAH